jgi:hypothetical protein
VAEGSTGAKKRASQGLALVPVAVALVLGALLLPRAVPPEDVPVPNADGRALGRIRDADQALAARARHDLLPADVRALGSAIRDFNVRQAHEEPDARLVEARGAIDRALPDVLDKLGPGPLIALRATQLDAFVAETRAFEATGAESDELAALGGSFVRRMRAAGWCTGHTLAMPEDARRVAFKLTWNATLGLDARPELAPALDEMRVLYTFYIRHPHAPEAVRERFDAARRSARDEKACRALDAGEALAVESWRIDKIKKLGALDPAYPMSFALGVAHFRHGNYNASAESFRDWLRAHPDGPWTIRARNHLRAALDEAGGS